MAVLAKKKKISYIGVLCYDNQQESRAISKESRTISGKTRFHARTIYVAISRVTRRDGLRLIVDYEETNEDDMIKNIMYTDFLFER